TRPTIERVAASARLEPVEPGHRVVTEGEPADRLYVIRAGAFSVERHGAHVASLGPRDWFGEIGLLRHTPRTATVVASSTGELWSIPGPEFLAAIAGSASPPTSLLDGVAARVAELDALDGTPSPVEGSAAAPAAARENPPPNANRRE